MPGPIRLLCLMAFLFAATVGGFAQTPANTSPVGASAKDEAELRAVVEQFFALYAKEDLDGLMKLWSEKSPDYGARRKTMAENFAKEDCRFSNLTITKVKVDGDKASLRASVERTVVDSPTKKERLEKMIRGLQMVRELGGWKVWQYAPAANDLAKALAEAPDEKARQALLAAEPELVTPELVAAIRSNGVTAARQGQSDQAMSQFQLAQTLSEKIKDRAGFADSLNDIGYFHYSQGNFPFALDLHQRSLKIREELDDRAGIATSLINIGNIHYGQGDYALALDFYQRSLKIREELGDRVGISNALLGIGNIHGDQGNLVLALEFYQRGLKIAEELNHKALIAILLNNIGNIYDGQSNYPLAIEYYQRSLKMSEEINDKAGIARSLSNIGNFHRKQGSYALALDFFQRSLKILEELGHRATIAVLLGNIGSIHGNQGGYALALDFHQRSLKIREEIKDKAGVAGSLGDIGIIYYYQGNYASALDYYQRSLRIKEELKDKVGVASSLVNIASLHNSQGNLASALDSYQRSLNIFEELGDKAGASASLLGIGNVHTSRGNYALALEFYQRSLRIKEELNDKASVADTLNNIGIVHYKQGSYALAMDFYQRSLKIEEEINDRAGISASLTGIGNVHAGQGNYAMAIDVYQRGLKIDEEINNKDGVAHALNNIGNVHYSQSNYASALEFYQRSLKIREELGDKVGLSESLNNIGVIYLNQGNFALAQDTAQKAAEIARSIGDTEMIFNACLTEGRAGQALNRLTGARRAFSESIAAAETLRADAAGGEQEAQLLFESKTAPYLALSNLLVSQNETAEALTLAERAKSRALLDVLQSGRVSVAKAMTAQEREQEDRLRAQLVALNTQAFQEKQQDKPDPERLKDLEAQRTKAQLAFDDFQSRLYASHPELKIQRGEMKPLSLLEAQALLPDDKTALLEFAVAEDKTLLFVLTKAAMTPDLKVFSIPIKSKDLTARAQKFRQTLADPKLDLGFKQEAVALYELLLKPAQALLKGKTSLVIVPDGALWEMPFQALVTNANRFLIEEATIGYAPSLTYLREMNRKRSAPSTGQPTLLAMGNPALAGQTISRAEFATRGEKLVPLPMAEKEAQALANLYGAKQSKVYIGVEALEERFKAEAGNYRILHLATHGVLDDRSPMYSHVLLSQAGGNEKEDGLLEAWEIMNLDLKADLAVLSACETARGRVGAGEGVIGLTWALFVAGVPTTVVSQWKVQDASTQQLMVEFHRQIKTKPAQGKAEALRQAALKVMKTERHPYHWAGFILVGDGR